jgi:hypothetical protein
MTITNRNSYEKNMDAIAPDGRRAVKVEAQM